MHASWRPSFDHIREESSWTARLDLISWRHSVLNKLEPLQIDWTLWGIRKKLNYFHSSGPTPPKQLFPTFCGCDPVKQSNVHVRAPFTGWICLPVTISSTRVILKRHEMPLIPVIHKKANTKRLKKSRKKKIVWQKKKNNGCFPILLIISQPVRCNLRPLVGVLNRWLGITALKEWLQILYDFTPLNTKEFKCWLNRNIWYGKH